MQTECYARGNFHSVAEHCSNGITRSRVSCGENLKAEKYDSLVEFVANWIASNNKYLLLIDLICGSEYSYSMPEHTTTITPIFAVFLLNVYIYIIISAIYSSSRNAKKTLKEEINILLSKAHDDTKTCL